MPKNTVPPNSDPAPMPMSTAPFNPAPIPPETRRPAGELSATAPANARQQSCCRSRACLPLGPRADPAVIVQAYHLAAFGTPETHNSDRRSPREAADSSPQYCCSRLQASRPPRGGMMGATRRPTDVADAAPELLLHRHDLVDDFVRRQVAREPALASGAERTPHGAPHLHTTGPSAAASTCRRQAEA